jgi:hypothetical protein
MSNVRYPRCPTAVPRTITSVGVPDSSVIESMQSAVELFVRPVQKPDCDVARGMGDDYV